ncbi:MAG: MFS transporter [Acidobacteriaceae bacterium]
MTKRRLAGGRSLRGHRAITLSLLFVAGIVNFLDRSSLSIANTSIRAEMHLNATDMGWLLSAFSLAYGFAQLPLIGLLDRAGTRSVLGAGLVLWSTAQMLTGFVRGLPSFLALRVLLGAGEAPFYPSGVRSVREWFATESRGRATAVMSMSQTIGLAVAPPLLTVVMLQIGWRAMFAGLGVSGLAVAAAWIAFHKPRGETSFREDAGTERAGESTWRALLGQRTVWGMMLGFGGINYTNWLYTAWLPGYLQAQRHLSLARSGWVAAIPFLAGALGMIASGTVADKVAKSGVALTTVHRRNLVAGMIVSAASTSVVANTNSTATAVGGISLALFCIHFAGTSGWGYVQAVSPSRYVASLAALQNFASFMIASAGPVLTGWLLDRTGSFQIALGVCSGVTLLGALSYATLASPSGMRLREG